MGRKRKEGRKETGRQETGRKTPGRGGVGGGWAGLRRREAFLSPCLSLCLSLKPHFLMSLPDVMMFLPFQEEEGCYCIFILKTAGSFAVAG